MARRTVAALACVLAMAACSNDPDVTAEKSNAIDTTPSNDDSDDGGAESGGDGGSAEPAPAPAPVIPSSDSTPDTAPSGGPAPTYPAPADSGDTGVGDPLWPDLGNPGIDVLDYDLVLDYDPATETIDGSVTLMIEATEDRDGFTLDANGPDVTSVTVRGESAEEITLGSFADGKQSALKLSDVAERTPLPSPMPQHFGHVLDRRAIRDLVQFIAAGD